MSSTIITAAIGILVAVVLIGPIAATITSQTRTQDCAYSSAPSSLRTTQTALGGTTAGVVGVPLTIGTTYYPAGRLCVFPATGLTFTTSTTIAADGAANTSGSGAATAGNFAIAETSAGSLAYDFASAQAIIVLIPLGIVAGLVYWGYSIFNKKQPAGGM